MAGVFEKLRIIGLSNLHDLLDAVVNWNDIGAVRQHIRDLESAKEKIEDASNKAKGRMRTLTREIKGHEERMATLQEAIDTIITDDDKSNDHLATTKEVEKEGVTRLRDTKKKQLAEQQQLAQNLDQALSVVKAKHQEAVNRLYHLEATKEGSEGMDEASAALKMVTEMITDGEAVSVDNIEQRILRKNDEASVRFEEAMGTFNDKSDKDTAVALARARIEARKKELAAKEQATPLA